MIEQRDVIEFFDRCAKDWDAGMLRNDDIINKILDNAGVGEGAKILDVACGTGILIPDYVQRKASSVTGIDISSEMIKRAEAKFDYPNVRFVCGDVETAELEGSYDNIVVYNAFPHFPDPARLVKRLSALLAPGGTLTVAHGMSRKVLDEHHKGSAHKVSRGLMHEDELEKLFALYLNVTVKISDEKMYQVAGVSKDK